MTARDESKVYGEDDPSFEAEAVGLVDGDSLSRIKGTRTTGEDAGEYTVSVTQEDGANPNYEITFKPGKLTITPRSIADAEVELGAALTANGKRQEQSVTRVTVKNGDGRVVEVDDYTVTDNQAMAPGTYTLTITGRGNFTGTVTKEFVILPGSLSNAEIDGNGDFVLGSGTIGLEIRYGDGAGDLGVETNKAELLDTLVERGGVTQEEIAQVYDGADIRVTLVLTAGEASVTAEEKAQIASAASGYEIGGYFDVSLFKQIIRGGVSEEPVRLTGTFGDITVSIKVPDSLLNKDSTVTRTFWVVRDYEGAVEFLPTEYNAQTLTFGTNKFSAYAIVYKDTKTGTSSPLNTATVEPPRTGDEAQIGLWFTLMLVSLSVPAVGAMLGRRKKTR